MCIKEKEGWTTKAESQRNCDLKRIWGTLLTNTALFTESEVRGQSFVSSSTHVHDGYTHRYWLWVVMDGWAVDLGDNYPGYRRSKLPLSHVATKHKFAFLLKFRRICMLGVRSIEFVLYKCVQCMWTCGKNVGISGHMHAKPEEDNGFHIYCSLFPRVRILHRAWNLPRFGLGRVWASKLQQSCPWRSFHQHSCNRCTRLRPGFFWGSCYLNPGTPACPAELSSHSL